MVYFFSLSSYGTVGHFAMKKIHGVQKQQQLTYISLFILCYYLLFPLSFIHSFYEMEFVDRCLERHCGVHIWIGAAG